MALLDLRLGPLFMATSTSHSFPPTTRHRVSSLTPSPRRWVGKRRGRVAMKAKAFFNPLEDPILKEGLKEPVAFLGGMFAGLLRLDLNEEPLREWINRTVEAAGLTVEEIKSEESKQSDDVPQQIEIE